MFKFYRRKAVRLTKSQKEYASDHRLAKFIVANVVAIVITVAQLTTLPLSMFLNLAAIYVWFFGVNPVQWIIESLRNHSHKVTKL